MAMTKQEKELTRRWVETWKKAGPELERIRRAEIRRTSTPQAMINLADAFESFLLHHKPRKTSGLVEQQARFMKLRKSSSFSACAQGRADEQGKAKGDREKGDGFHKSLFCLSEFSEA